MNFFDKSFALHAVFIDEKRACFMAGEIKLNWFICYRRECCSITMGVINEQAQYYLREKELLKWGGSQDWHHGETHGL